MRRESAIASRPHFCNWTTIIWCRPAPQFRASSTPDQPGVRIAVVRNHASTLPLSRILKHAEPISAELQDAAFDLLRTGHADA
jgi:hypothetical protein